MPSTNLGAESVINQNYFQHNCPENVTSILRFSWNLGDRLDQAQSTPLHDPTHWRKVNTVDEQRHQLN